MKTMLQQPLQIVFLLRFFVIIGFLLSSFSFLATYSYKLFSPINKVIFNPPINAYQEQLILEKLQLKEKHIASFYFKKKQFVLLDSVITLDLLPPNTLKANVQKIEYLAYFIVNDKSFLISKELFFIPIDKIKDIKFPKLIFLSEDLKESELKISESIVVQNLLTLLDFINQNNHFLKDNVSEIYFNDNLNVILIFTPQDLPIFLGYDDFKMKIKNLSSVFDKLEEDFFLLSKIDIRYKDKIILEYRHE